MKNILFIPNNAGFFSNFNKIITHIWIFKIRNLIDDNTNFYVKWFDYIDFKYGGDNLWSTLFTSLIPAENSEKTEYDTIIKEYYHQEEEKFISTHTHNILNKDDKRWRYELNQIYNKYIQLNPIFKEEVNSFYKKHFEGYYVICVHIRSSFHKNEQYNRDMISVHDRINIINDHIKTLKVQYKIYLATDIIDAIDIFKNIYNDKLVYLDTNKEYYRDNQDHSVLNSSINKGKAIMKDALLLSMGNILFHSISNVTFAALFINPDIPNVYIY